LLFSLILLVAYCINTLVRRQWADHERLTFPIIWLPLEMTEAGAGTAFFRSRLMWGGFAVAAGLNLWNGIAFLYPSLPTLPIGIIDIKPLFTTKPWNAIDWTPITLYPLAIGLSYLLPLDLLFSCWFFYLFWKGQRIVASAMAWDTTPDVPFIAEQGFGSVLGLSLYYLWSGREHYARLLRSGAQALRRSGVGRALSFPALRARVAAGPRCEPRSARQAPAPHRAADGVPGRDGPQGGGTGTLPAAGPEGPEPSGSGLSEGLSENAALGGIAVGLAGLFLF